MAGTDSKSRDQQPVSNVLVQMISAEVTEDIVTGRLKPGVEINSVDLAQRFNTSRTPVREALLTLAAEGLVTIEVGKRPHVSRLTRKSLVELYELRIALMQLATDLFLTSENTDRFSKLDPIEADIRQALRSKDCTNLYLAAQRLQRDIVEQTQNTLLSQTLARMQSQASRMQHYVIDNPDLLMSISHDNLRLLQALRERDTATARALINSTMSRVRSWLLEMSLLWDESGMPPAKKRRRIGVQP